MSLHLRICHDTSGTWSVHGLSPLPAAHLPSVSASLDYARRECAAAPATIELLIYGFYAVVHQGEGWPPTPYSQSQGGSAGGSRNEDAGRAVALRYSEA